MQQGNSLTAVGQRVESSWLIKQTKEREAKKPKQQHLQACWGGFEHLWISHNKLLSVQEMPDGHEWAGLGSHEKPCPALSGLDQSWTRLAVIDDWSNLLHPDASKGLHVAWQRKVEEHLTQIQVD